MLRLLGKSEDENRSGTAMREVEMDEAEDKGELEQNAGFPLFLRYELHLAERLL